METCTKCGERKPAESFTKPGSRQCDDCHAAYAQAYRKTVGGLERTRAASRAWVTRNPDRAETSNYHYRTSNAGRAQIRANKLEARYGMDPGGWDALFEMQGRRCACCGRIEPGGRGWHTDHDHESQRVRGILCGRCNKGIGMLGDDQHGALRAVEYLRVPFPPEAEEYLALTGDLREVFA